MTTQHILSAVLAAVFTLSAVHGAEDEGYPLSVVDKVVQELRAAKVPFQYEVYSGTGHGFSDPKNKAEERQCAVDCLDRAPLQGAVR